MNVNAIIRSQFSEQLNISSLKQTNPTTNLRNELNLKNNDNSWNYQVIILNIEYFVLFTLSIKNQAKIISTTKNIREQHIVQN
ncbi:hypothetical protein TTHERM_000809448 (macronuclear) [Tetrahymena thermophila SB210]|uniref:Uncharacterized protein n=1 Tax=Tetrahymena thermophila (strain SB210) TaxID=312017 RepID=W7XD86_TETTS|nr:hypothetical protein TTHERM_000809448 [Tetrahymena thermophila SB210]EWS75467.1 hypothetical protein TTHERM_000809448 [Tetrahymena thermophila SB210]|eukprot:XP_012652014.1 hypothetical protein TTHERM_000809448 [Tetrahymena thermophila SB210]